MGLFLNRIIYDEYTIILLDGAYHPLDVSPQLSIAHLTAGRDCDRHIPRTISRRSGSPNVKS